MRTWRDALEEIWTDAKAAAFLVLMVTLIGLALVLWVGLIWRAFRLFAGV